MSLNSEEHIDYLCSLLYKLSKVKKNSFFGHLYHIQTEAITNAKNLKELTVTVPSASSSLNQRTYVYKSSDLSDKLLKATLIYMEKSNITGNPLYASYRTTFLGTRIFDLRKDSNIFDVNGVRYLRNPLFNQFSYCENYTIEMSKLINSFPIAEHDAFEVLNSWLFYLYQLVSLNKVVAQQSREFYTQLNQRNKSVQKLVASISSNLVLKHFCQIDVSWDAPSPIDLGAYSKQRHMINNLRADLLSTLRNEFASSKNLLPVKYLWLLTSNQQYKASIELHIITQNHEEEGHEAFHTNIKQLLAKFHQIAQKHDFNVSVLNHQNPVINKMDKAQVLKELSFKESGYFIDFPELSKSSFGCGGVGGRKYK